MSKTEKHLLCVSYHSTVPHNTGANVRMLNLLQHLENLRPVLLAPAPQENDLEHRMFAPMQFPQIIRKTFGFNPAILGCYGNSVFQRAMRAISDIEVSAVQCEHLWSFPLAQRLARARQAPLILIEHNVEVIYVERAYRMPLFTQITAHLERKAIHASDRVVVCSEIDAGHLSARFGISPEKIWIVPNGINLPEIRQKHSRETLPAPLRDKTFVLFLGKTNYPPNAEAIRVIAEELAPRAQAQNRDLVFVVVGGPQSPDYSRVHQGLAFTGFVEDLQPLLHHAAACIAPLLSGSGTRLKILEYAAHAKPIVATRVAAEGLNFADGKEIIFADDWHDFVRAVCAIVDGKLDQNTMANLAYQKVVNEYQWQAIAAGYQKRLQELIDLSSPSREASAKNALPRAARSHKAWPRENHAKLHV